MGGGSLEQPAPRRELSGPGLVPASVHDFHNTAKNFIASMKPVQYQQVQPHPQVNTQVHTQHPQAHTQVQPQQPQQPQPQLQSKPGINIGRVGFSVAAGLFPFPLNPLFIPIQMTVFIILIIILLINGFSFKTAALMAWLIPALFAAVAHYMIMGAVFGGEDNK